MRNHLLGRHKKLQDLDSEKRQTTLSAWHSSVKELSKPKYQSLNRSLAVMCALDLRPMSRVEGKGFRYFCGKLNPAYQVSCASTVGKNLDHLYEECKKDLIDLIKGHDVSFTTDMWTSLRNHGYITVTAHFILEWKLHTKILATRKVVERHTGVNIANLLLKIHDEFKIGSVPALVTDNAPNMQVAAKESGIPRWPCFSHTLQLAVEDGLKVPAITKALAFARRVVTHFSHSVASSEALADHQKKQGKTPLGPIQDVPTRWNSQYFMSKRLIHLRQSVYAVLLADDLTKSADRAALDLKESTWKY